MTRANKTAFEKNGVCLFFPKFLNKNYVSYSKELGLAVMEGRKGIEIVFN